MGALGAVTGFMTGNEGDKTAVKNTSGVNLDPASQAETEGRTSLYQAFSELKGMLNQSGAPGSADYKAGIDSQRDLAAMYGDYAKSGGLPTADDITTSDGVAKNLFGARQVALNQSFEDQNTQAQRLSAQLGRPVNDPIIQAKLRTGFMRQQDQLGAEQQATSQQLALQLPQNRLNYAGQQTNALTQIGQQAMSNQNFLFGLGSTLQNSERDFRLQTSQKYNNSNTTVGGGFAQGLSGAIGGGFSELNSVTGLAGSFTGGLTGMGGMGGGGGGGSGGASSYFQTPQAAPAQPYGGVGNYGGQLQQSSAYQLQPGFNPYFFSGGGR